jgi:hypothetical protein
MFGVTVVARTGENGNLRRIDKLIQFQRQGFREVVIANIVHLEIRSPELPLMNLIF